MIEGQYLHRYLHTYIRRLNALIKPDRYTLLLNHADDAFEVRPGRIVAQKRDVAVCPLLSRLRFVAPCTLGIPRTLL